THPGSTYAPAFIVTPRMTLALEPESSASALPMPFWSVTSTGFPASIGRNRASAATVILDLIRKIPPSNAASFSAVGSAVARILAVRALLPMMRRPLALMASTCSAFVSSTVTLAADESAAAKSPPMAPQPTMRICVLMPRLCAGEALRRSPPTHVGEREAGHTLVVFRQRAQFVLGDIFFEIIERPVADEFLYLDVDEIGRVLAVGAHHLCRGPGPGGLIGLQRIARVRTAAQQVGEGARVDCRLRRARGTARIHRMPRAPCERNPAEGPLVDRILVDHRIFEDLVGVADHLCNIEPIEAPAFVERKENTKIACLVPVVLLERVALDLGHPVDQLASLAVDIVDDGIDDDLAGQNRTEPHVSPAVENRLAPRCAAPGIDARKSDFVGGIKLSTERRIDA